MLNVTIPGIPIDFSYDFFITVSDFPDFHDSSSTQISYLHHFIERVGKRGLPKLMLNFFMLKTRHESD